MTEIYTQQSDRRIQMSFFFGCCRALLQLSRSGAHHRERVREKEQLSCVALRYGDFETHFGRDLTQRTLGRRDLGVMKVTFVVVKGEHQWLNPWVQADFPRCFALFISFGDCFLRPSFHHC